MQPNAKRFQKHQRRQLISVGIAEVPDEQDRSNSQPLMKKLHSLIFVLTTVAAWLLVSEIKAQSPDEFADEGLARGMIARFQQGDQSVSRIERSASLSWLNAPIDPRLKAEPFRGELSGYLETVRRGGYQFAAYSSSPFELRINDQELLGPPAKTKRINPAWLTSDVIELPPDLHKFVIQFGNDTPSIGKFKLYWRGPDFEWEPIARHRLLHDLEDSPTSTWDQGRQLVTSLRCNACHEVQTGLPLLPAPPRNQLGTQVSTAWMKEHLTATTETGESRFRKMPYLSLSETDAAALIAYLRKDSGEAAQATPEKASEERTKQGEELVLTRGCIGCHGLDRVGEPSPYSGGDLGDLKEKRSLEWVKTWLEDPDSLLPSHRMPKVDLSDEEISLIADFLLSESEPTKDSAIANVTPSMIKNGERLFLEMRCGNCHQPTNANSSPEETQRPLVQIVNQAIGCLSPTNQETQSPQFSLTEFERAAIQDFLRNPLATSVRHPEWELESRNCFTCHQRDERPGRENLISQIVERRPDLKPIAPAMRAPSLDGVGG